MRAAAKTVKELLAAAAREEEGFRPWVVSVVQTFGERANVHPHVHALVTRGGWTGSGEWVPVPYVAERSAEELFRHKVLWEDLPDRGHPNGGAGAGLDGGPRSRPDPSDPRFLGQDGRRSHPPVETRRTGGR